MIMPLQRYVHIILCIFFFNFQFYFNLAELLAPGNLPLPLGLKPGSHMPPVPPSYFSYE